MTSRTLALVSLASLLFAAACGGGGSKVDEVVAGAAAKCEASTAALKVSGPSMLPGRACGTCHKAGGQAPDADTRWTAAGTVYGSATSMCNSGGVADATVEIFEGLATTAKVTLKTNSAGNFNTTMALTFPVRAKVSKGGKSAEMTTPMATGNCASCHQFPGENGAPGRIFLN